jgi:hypothetical protein
MGRLLPRQGRAAPGTKQEQRAEHSKRTRHHVVLAEFEWRHLRVAALGRFWVEVSVQICMFLISKGTHSLQYAVIFSP